MLDIKVIRENLERVKKGITDKQFNPNVVDEILDLDERRRALLQKIEAERAEKNKIAQEASKTQTTELIERGKIVRTEIQSLEADLKDIEQAMEKAIYQIPNLPADDVKVGRDERENEVLRKWGQPTVFDFPPKSHVEIGEKLDIIDIQRAAKISGARFYYLKNEGVLLEFALIQLALDTLIKEGFIPIIPPVLIRKDIMRALGYTEHGQEDDIFDLPKDDLFLVGTSEQSIAPIYKDEILSEKELPKRFVGFSTCFRREAGSYGKDTKGILRVHQFDKVEMVSYVKQEEGDKEHEYLLSLEEKLLQILKLPYQVTKMCTGDLGFPAARKYDIEVWIPSENKYRELTSTSTTTDFQARGLNIKYRENNQVKYVNILNGTAFSTRPIIAILENYQQKDGSVLIPEVLQKYLGKGKITPKKT